MGMFGVSLGGGGHLVHRSAGFLHRPGLVGGAGANGVGGPLCLADGVLQIAEEGIEEPGKNSDLILAASGKSLGQVALAAFELGEQRSKAAERPTTK